MSARCSLCAVLTMLLAACAAPTQGNPPPLVREATPSTHGEPVQQSSDPCDNAAPGAGSCAAVAAGSSAAGQGGMPVPDNITPDAALPSAGSSAAGSSAEACDLPAANPEYFCDPHGDGACQNCSDCQKVESGEAKAAAKACGTDCGTDRDCATRCVKDRINPSDACTACLVDLYDCLINNCLVECVGSSEQCSQCSSDKKGSDGLSCSDKWFACSGTEKNPSY